MISYDDYCEICQELNIKYSSADLKDEALPKIIKALIANQQELRGEVEEIKLILKIRGETIDSLASSLRVLAERL